MLLLASTPCRAETVLVVFSEGQQSSRAGSLLHGLRVSLPKSHVRAAYLDMAANASEDDAYAAFLRLEATLPPEGVGIIAVGSQAAAFVRMFADRPPFDAPVVAVAAGLENSLPATRSLPVEQPLFAMIRKQHPDARTYVIFTTPDTHGEQSRARLEALARHAPQRPLLVFPGFEAGRMGLLDEKSMLALVRGVPDDAVLVVMGLPADEPDEGFVPELVEASPVPVYAGGGTSFVAGMDGAVITDWFELGRSAAALLQGQVSDTTVEVPPRIQYDLHDREVVRPPDASDAREDGPLLPGAGLLAILAVLVLMIPLVSFLLLRKR